MNRWANLKFFDKNGNNYNFDYNSKLDIWSGSIDMPEVSTNLFEVVQLFVLEEVINITTGLKEYVYPHANVQSTATEGWNIEWEQDDPKELMLFQFDLDFDTGTQSSLIRENDGPQLESYDEILFELDYDDESTFNTSGFLETTLLTSTALQINIAFTTTVENTYKRTLIIRDTYSNIKIAEFEIYAESIEEDERLKVMTENFGYKVLYNDSTIFKNTDINEILPNFIELNRKRKEMMLEGHNIYPYVGSYKGLINAIKFFGYNNLQIKEFWKNVDRSSPMFGKHVHSNPISLLEPGVNLNNSTFSLPNKKFKKTSIFSLVYKLNEIQEGEYGDGDLPIVEETSDFTTEEIIIKLFGLKKKLEKDFLPLNAKIKDIIGEADFFGLQEVTNTISRNHKNNIEVGLDPTFKVTPENCTYLQDLRSIIKLYPPCITIGESIIGDSFICPLPGYPGQNLALGPFATGEVITQPSSDGILGQAINGDDYTISDLADFYLAYFGNYAPNIKTVEQLPDKPGIPVGSPIVLENTSFSNLIWDDVDSTWLQLDNGSLYFNIDFEPVNPTAGDIFTIKDPSSDSGAIYTVLPGDTTEIVRNALYAQLEALRTSFNDPWLYYDISKQDTDSGPVIRIFGNNINLLSATVDKNLGSTAELRTEVLPNSALFNWDSVLRGNYIDIEWTIIKDETEMSPSYYYNVSGSLVDFEKLPVILPYVGDYTVEMKLFDTYNNVSIKVENQWLCVEDKQVEYSGWYRGREAIYSWETEGDFIWNDFGAYWDLAISPDVTWDEETPNLYESLDTVNAILNNFGVTGPDFQIMNFQNNGDYSFTGPYFWDNLDTGNWNDTYHLWWDATNVTGDTPAYFEFKEIYANSYLTIKDTNNQVGRFYFDPSYTTLADVKNALNISNDSVINKYIYNLVLNASNDEMYIQAVAKYTGTYGDFLDVDVLNADGDRICDVTDAPTGGSFTGCESLVYRSGQSIIGNASWNDIKFINDGKILPRYTWCMFIYDKCKINGKKNARWIIRNLSTPNSSDIYLNSKYLTYLFKDLGKYEIELELEDTNGNFYSKSRNIVVIK